MFPSGMRCPKKQRGNMQTFDIVKIGDATLYHSDCREVLPTLGKFDLLLTDPPYGIGEDGGEKNRVRSGDGRTRFSEPKHAAGRWDSERPTKETFSLMESMAAVRMYWGGNYFADYLPPSMGWLYWDKKIGGDFSDGELAWTSRRCALRSFSMHAFTGLNGGKDRQHPTQKPLALMAWCLTHAPAAKSVLDPFMGSGTTGVACAQSGRSFTGIERERKYFDIACERISRAYAQGKLFAPEVVKPEQSEITA